MEVAQAQEGRGNPGLDYMTPRLNIVEEGKMGRWAVESVMSTQNNRIA